ncbi:PLC-like phosphodiesterase [Fimicolochytrium jonesii]|uniref:PLC-like phosphodiesterase n=1 Tax=Fimicolochytrium jonesii TaxID=1396493 RepID=UPI0022FDB75D|nr:PLC-like phosphodiesterase [Fimicolochytrium jonesii]KAI8818574.1 PLC-like phosphodiesterase [Fimicolochytrium jonesii]
MHILSFALVAVVARCAHAAVIPQQHPLFTEGRPWKTVDGEPTKLFGHRGERAFALPEHSLPSYHMAVWEHADFIEPDLVLTKDNVLVIYHDLSIKSSTDVADHPEFQHLKRNATIWDPWGNAGNVTLVDDWFINDFTLGELKTLKLRAVGGGADGKNMRTPRYFDDIFRIPTFQEYLDLVHDDSIKADRVIGIVPELKHPSWHNERVGKPHFMEDLVLQTLEANGYPLRKKDKAVLDAKCTKPRGPVVIQSFEPDAAKFAVEGVPSKCPNTDFLLWNVDILTPKGLNEVAIYATALGPWKGFYLEGIVASLASDNATAILPLLQKTIDANGGLIPAKHLSKEIKKRGLKQMPYTFYSSYDVPAKKDHNAGDTALHERTLELFYFMAQGMDALFVENVAEAVLIRQRFVDRYGLSGRTLGARADGKDEADKESELEALRTWLVGVDRLGRRN